MTYFFNKFDSFRNGRTPVHAAAYNDHIESLQMLLNSGGEVNRSDSLGRTPLMYACMNGQSAALGKHNRHNRFLFWSFTRPSAIQTRFESGKAIWSEIWQFC